MRSVLVAVRILRIETDGFAVVGDSLFDFPALDSKAAPVQICSGELRIETDGLIVAGERVLQLSEVVPGNSSIVESPGVPGIELDRFIEVADRFVELLFLDPVETTIDMHLHALGGRVLGP